MAEVRGGVKPGPRAVAHVESEPRASCPRSALPVCSCPPAPPAGPSPEVMRPHRAPPSEGACACAHRVTCSSSPKFRGPRMQGVSVALLCHVTPVYRFLHSLLGRHPPPLRMLCQAPVRLAQDEVAQSGGAAAVLTAPQPHHGGACGHGTSSRWRLPFRYALGLGRGRRRTERPEPTAPLCEGQARPLGEGEGQGLGLQVAVWPSAHPMATARTLWRVRPVNADHLHRRQEAHLLGPRPRRSHSQGLHLLTTGPRKGRSPPF